MISHHFRIFLAYLFKDYRTERRDFHYVITNISEKHFLVGKFDAATATAVCLHRSYANTLQMVADGRGIVYVVFCASSIKNGLNLMGGLENWRGQNTSRQQP
jgi:hypothetical protein